MAASEATSVADVKLLAGPSRSSNCMQRVVHGIVDEEEPEEHVCARGRRPLRRQQCSICHPLARSLVEAGGEAPQAIEGVWGVGWIL